MTRLAIIAALAFAFAVLLCYGAMRTAQAIAQTEATKVFIEKEESQN